MQGPAAPTFGAVLLQHVQLGLQSVNSQAVLQYVCWVPYLGFHTTSNAAPCRAVPCVGSSGSLSDRRQAPVVDMRPMMHDHLMRSMPHMDDHPM